MKIEYIVMILSLLDLTATYFYVSTFNQKFPQLDYKTLEANPILRMAWKQWGLGLGMILGGFLVFSLLTLLVFNMTENWRWFLMGTLSMMCIYHYLNFVQLSGLKGT